MTWPADRLHLELPPHLLAQLPTPCLLVDLPAADRNVTAAQRMVRGSDVMLRPHFKAHKCTELMRRQVRAPGCRGVTCQTPSEAVTLAAAGFTDILVANEVVDQFALAQLADAAQIASITVAADCVRHVELLERAAATADTHFGVLAELDVGAGRCGLPVGNTNLVPLAAAIASASRLTFAGIQAYAGHAVLVAGRELRRTLCYQVELQVAAELDRLAKAGFSCPIVTGGGTGTLEFLSPGTVFTEAQAGSYVLLDAAYHRLGLPFEPALFCVASVVSRPEPERAILDAGLKSLSVDQGLPVPLMPELHILGLSDEHTRLAVTREASLTVGDKIALLPSHIDPTVNLHDVLHVFDGTRLARWPVDGRRCTPVAGLGLQP